MKTPLLSLFCAAALSATHAQVVTNLLQDSVVRSSGSYTYYARGEVSGSSYVNITPFTRTFYPGYSTVTAASHGGSNANNNEGYPYTVQDTGSNSGPIPLSGLSTPSGLTNGKLADGSTSTNVSGWVGVVSTTGYFDILIDLGAQYSISSIVINYTDSSGRRWSTAADAQLVYTATSLSSTPVDSDFTLFDTGTFTSNASMANATFENGSTVTARYVNLRLSTSVGTSTTGGSYGGLVNEVSIMGAAVPEPSTVALGFASLGLCLFLRRLSSRSVIR